MRPDWTAPAKSRRRSRSAHVRPRSLIRSALIGALLALLAAALLNLVVTDLAERSLPGEGGSLGLGARAYYAWCTLYAALSSLFSRVLAGSGAMLVTAAAGAVIGALFYLTQTNYRRLSRKPHRGKHAVSRRRRRR